MQDIFEVYHAPVTGAKYMELCSIMAAGAQWVQRLHDERTNTTKARPWKDIAIAVRASPHAVLTCSSRCRVRRQNVIMAAAYISVPNACLRPCCRPLHSRAGGVKEV